ncbi:hypothetical protein LMG28138_05669 [Pararobbsia alpina]|uniref:Uncharacterized protein n=1 Tax=Pararobbsia alpina TaxID=621374 RepID=A0A6S7BM83_9BURK|nr:hypothetical protein LMG28138_05669 [Pararobbsia alpina]
MLRTLTTTLRLLTKRWLTLAEEQKALDIMLDSLTNQHAAVQGPDSLQALFRW